VKQTILTITAAATLAAVATLVSAEPDAAANTTVGASASVGSSLALGAGQPQSRNRDEMVIAPPWLQSWSVGREPASGRGCERDPLGNIRCVELQIPLSMPR
jgi:hypothetical protein